MSKSNHPWRISALYPDSYAHVPGPDVLETPEFVEAVLSLPAYATNRSMLESRIYQE
jgi:hypothetical protein